MCFVTEQIGLRASGNSTRPLPEWVEHAGRSLGAPSAYLLLCILVAGDAGQAFAGPPAGSGPQAVVSEVVSAASVPRDDTWSLARMIETAVSDNPRVRAQKSAASAVHYDADAARWEYFPSPALQGEAAAVGGNGTDRQLIFSLTQPLYSFGRISSGVDAAEARARVADMSVEESRFTMATRVLDAYAQFSAASRALRVFEDELSRLGKLEEMIRNRVDTGISASADYNLVATRMGQSRNAITAISAQRRSSAEALSQLVGAQLPPEVIEVADRPQTDRMVAEIESALARQNVVQRSLDVSPVIKRAGTEIDVARADKRRARASLLPTIFARFEHRSDSGRYDVANFPDTRVVIGSQLTFGAGLSGIERVRSSNEQENAARMTREAARTDITANVVADLESWRAARRLVVSLRENRDVQQDTAESYNRMFLAGKRSWLDLLNMVREQTQIDRELADAEAQIIVRGYRLMLATGQLEWQASK